MNLTPEKALARELRRFDRLSSTARTHLLIHKEVPELVRDVTFAESCVVDDFKHYLQKLPNFALEILRKRIAMPENPRRFSTSKLKVLDAAIRKAHSSLCCPFCHARFHAAGFPSHSCRKAPETSVPVKSYANGARHLTHTEMAIARIKAGLPCSAKLRRAVELENRKAVQS